jgi:hypothetical protein
MHVADAVVEVTCDFGTDGVPDRWAGAARHAVGADGRYEAKIGANPAFDVRAVVPGRAASPAVRVEIAAGTHEAHADLRLTADRIVSGVVTSASGTPVEGAWIRIARPADARSYATKTVAGPGSSQGEIPRVAATTDAEGRFVLDAIDDGAWQLTVEAAGFRRETVRASSPAAAPLRVKLSPPVRIAGRVRLADGRPAAGASVFLAGGGTPLTSCAGEDGSFAFDDLDDAPYVLSVGTGPPPALSIQRRMLSDVRPGTEPLDVVVEAASSISGRFLAPDGRPLAMCNVQLFRPGDEPMSHRYAGGAFTDADGRFAFNGLDDGRFQLLASPARSGTTRDLAPTFVDGVTAGTVGLDVVAAKGQSISGVVVDRDGRPVTGFVVDVQTPASASPDANQHPQWSRVFVTELDAAGKFVVGGLPPGRYRLVLTDAKDHRPAAVQIDGDAIVTAGAGPVRLVASTGTTISGVVGDAEGNPLITSLQLVATPGGEPVVERTRGNSGEFVFSGLDPARRYRLVAACGGFLTVTLDDVAPGAHDLKIRLPQGLDATGHLYAADGAALSGADLRFRRDGVEDPPNVRSGEGGAFSAFGLREGEYRAEAFVRDPADATKGEWRECGTLRAGDSAATLRLSR